MMSEVKNGELLFVKSVKDGIPNRDPLKDSDARRIFGEEDGRISLSDVSIKRDVRDYISKRFTQPGADPDNRYFVFVREERTDDGKLLGRESLANSMLAEAGRDKEKNQVKAIMDTAFDARVFGIVYSVKRTSFHKTGPVQFGWAHSLHPVESKYVQGTVVMPAKDVVVAADDTSEGKTQGTIWTTYIVPFAVFAMPGVINSSIAMETGMNQDDVDVLLEALWKGTSYRQARGRGLQQPLFLMHVEYSDPFFRIGYLEDYMQLKPAGREQWLGPNPPSSLASVSLDVTRLAHLLSPVGIYKDKIDRIRYWANPELKIIGNIPGERQEIW
jgi:CRISPR-associated protein Csh2